jgi:hypothetical protein
MYADMLALPFPLASKFNRNKTERLQALHKGDNVPAPLKLQVLGETPTLSEQDSHS